MGMRRPAVWLALLSLLGCGSSGRVHSGQVDAGAGYARCEVLPLSAWYVADEARELERSGKTGEARARRTKALELYAKAEKQLLAVPEDAPARGEALYWAGMCCYCSMGLLGGRNRTEAEARAVEEYCDRALRHFDAYREWIRRHPLEPAVSGDDGVSGRKEAGP